MRWVTSSRGRSALVSAVTLVMLLGSAGCTGDDDGGDEPGPPSGGGEAAAVATVTTLQNVGKGLDAEHRTRVKERANELIDPWIDGAFLGEFPRSDYDEAFAGFSQGAAADAQRDLDVLSNDAIGDRIDSASAVHRRVRLDVFAPDGHPRGITAHVVLVFTTAGELEETRRVKGDLYLARDQGVWRIFGYDVDEAVTL